MVIYLVLVAGCGRAAVAVMGRSTPSLCAGLSKRQQIPVILLGSSDVMSCMGLGRSDWGLSCCCSGGSDPLSPCIWCVGVGWFGGVWGPPSYFCIKVF